MEQKQDNRYHDLTSYAQKVHEKKKKRVKASGIVLIVLPVVLGLIRWMTDSDKIVFLVIWVNCMFAISAYLVSIEYVDHKPHQFAFDDEDDAEDDAKADAKADATEGGDA